MAKVRWSLYRGKSKLVPDKNVSIRINRLFRVAQDVALETGLVAVKEHDGVAFYQKEDTYFGNSLSILISPRNGGLVPDGWPADDGEEEYCDEAAWKAAAIAGLLARITLSQEDAHDMEFARKVFAGEILHPSIAAGLR